MVRHHKHDQRNTKLIYFSCKKQQRRRGEIIINDLEENPNEPTRTKETMDGQQVKQNQI